MSTTSDPNAVQTAINADLGAAPNRDPRIEVEATRQRSPDHSDELQDNRSCLVQIYPADVVEGMMLLECDELLIGRDGAAGLMLPDTSVSRRHAVIERTEHGFEIRDLDSTNGTYVAGEMIPHAKLQSGDTIRIGSFLFKFLSAGSVESKYHETVYSALTRDALTGTMNRRYLIETLDRAIGTAIRSQHFLTVMMVDIDHFKSVNDTHGHLVGDEILREFGERVSRGCREDDLLARYGGEEFCLLLSGTDSDEASAVAQRCRQSVSGEPFQTTVGPLEITASFGFACLDPKKAETGTELIQRADEQLYSAKRSGRNCVCG